LSKQFNHPVSSVAWAMIIVSIIGTGVGAAGAGLGANLGNRRVLLVMVSATLVGGVIGALSNSLPLLIVGRGIQGIGFGGIAVGLGIASTYWSGRKLRSAITIIMAISLVGSLVGYMLGGIMWKLNADWHNILWVVAAIAAVTLVMIVALVKETPLRKVSVDFIGVIGVIAWSVLILLPLSQANSWGWGSSKVLELLVPGVAVLILWVLWELRSSAPLIDLRILVRMGVWQGALLWFAAAFAIYAFTTAVPYLIEDSPALGGFGKDVFMVSVAFALTSVINMVVSPFTPTLMRKIGNKGTMLLGALFGLAGFGLAGARGSLWMVFVWVALGNIPFMWGGTAAFAVATEAVPARLGGVSTAILRTCLSIGSAVATAVTGYILTLRTVVVEIPGVPPRALPTSQMFTWVAIVTGAVGVLSILGVLTINSKKFHIADREG